MSTVVALAFACLCASVTLLAFLPLRRCNREAHIATLPERDEEKLPLRRSPAATQSVPLAWTLQEVGAVEAPAIRRHPARPRQKKGSSSKRRTTGKRATSTQQAELMRLAKSERCEDGVCPEQEKVLPSSDEPSALPQPERLLLTAPNSQNKALQKSLRRRGST
jgi:hypothetical protein